MAPGGLLTAAKLRKLAEAAEKYGDGTVHLSELHIIISSPF
jgi:dissimilatory sulfite reductase (desulfoviridin) alpha/beta subunit